MLKIKEHHYSVNNENDHAVILSKLVDSVNHLSASIEKNNNEIAQVISQFNQRVSTLEAKSIEFEAIKGFKTPIYSNWYSIVKVIAFVSLSIFAIGQYFSNNRLIATESTLKKENQIHQLEDIEKQRR